MKRRNNRQWGANAFPTLAEIKIAEGLGMDANEYCTALNDAEDYRQQLSKENNNGENDET